MNSQKTVWNLCNVFVCMYINLEVKFTERELQRDWTENVTINVLKKLVSIQCQMVIIILGIKSRNDYKGHHIKSNT